MQKASRDWIEKEFNSVQFGDRRLSKRLKEITRDLSRSPQASIPQASGAWARTKGAYRFFDHPGVSASEILKAHGEAALDRATATRRLFMVQDTTSLNYAAQAADSGLGPIGRRDKAHGLWMHTTLGLDAQGTAMGVLHAHMWARDPAAVGISKQRQQREIADKESHRWLASFRASVEVAQLLPATQVINIADREGDIYELFAEAVKHPEVGVLVRARHDRPVEGEHKSLWKFIAAQNVAGQIEITVPRKPGVASYQTQLVMRYGAVTIQARGRQALQLWMVEARQSGVPAEKAICWRLLTNQPVTDLESAIEKVQWYRLRWRIEEFHRVLKSGCKAESRQLETMQRLENVLAIDMVIAWRVMEMSRASRCNTDLPAAELLTEEEVRILCAMCPRLKGKASSLTLREAVRAIAQWGGFLGRKGDGEPGPSSLWLGLQRLHHYCTAFATISKSMGNA